MPRGKKSKLDIPVKFGGVSIGQQTARIGITFDRSNVDLETADEVFCGHRLSGRVVLGNRDDAPGQKKLLDTDFEVAGSFDTKHLSVNSVSIGAGLTFSLSDVDIAELARFSKGTGRLIVDQVAEIPDDAADDSDDEDDDEKAHVPGSLHVEGDPLDGVLAEIFKGQKRIIKAFEKAGLETVKDLSDYTTRGDKIVDIPGMGPGSAEIVSETMINFWSDNGPGTSKRNK